MRILWTTDAGADPGLRQVFAADRPSAVATAVIGGIDVVVTLTDEHEDFDCHLGDLHHERCPAPGMRVWDRATGALIRAVHDVGDNGTGHPAVFVTVVVDGRPLAVVRDWARPPKVIDLETGHRLGELPGHDNAMDVQDIAVVDLADGPAVVTGGWDGILRVTALTSGRTTSVDTGEQLNSVTVLYVDGRPVAGTGRDAVTLWDLVDGSRAGVLSLADGQVPAAIVSWPDRNPKIAVLDTDGALVLVDVGTGSRRLLREFPLRPWSIAALTGTDGRPLLGIEDGETVRLWDVHADAPFGAPLAGPVRNARMFGGGPGVLLVGSPTDDAISVWDLDGTRPRGSTGHRTDIRCLTVTPDGGIVAGGSDGVLSQWRLADGARGADLGSLPGRVNAVAAVRCQAQTYLLAVGGDLHEIPDGTLYRWAGGNPLPPIAIDHHGQVDIALTFALDGEPMVLTAGCDGQIHLTEVRTGLRLRTMTDAYPPRGAAIGLLAGRPAAAICGMFGPFTVRDLAADTAITTPAAAGVEIGEAARGWINTDAGPTVITVRQSLVRTHNLWTGAVSQLQPGQDAPVIALATTDDPARPGAVAIARADCSVSVVDAATRQDICRLMLPYPAQALTWAPARRLIMASRRDLYCAEVPSL